MLSRLREHLGGAGLIVAIVALVAALAGGAIAATGGSGDGKATASAKAKKGPRGPKGPKGDTGPAGPAGPAGAKGDTGAAGANGSNGADGPKGATGNQGNQGAKGAAGATGPTGPTGETGYTETLPPGETETGTWAITTSTPGFLFAATSISFPIPLAEPGGVLSAFAFTKAKTENEEFNEHCPGSLAEPDADPGFLCVYSKEESIANGESALGVSAAAGADRYGTTGVWLNVALLSAESEPASVEAWGTWAVTAPLD